MSDRKFVVVVERSEGNEHVGNMWLDTGIFPDNFTLGDAYDWVKKNGIGGKIILTLASEIEERVDNTADGPDGVDPWLQTR